MQSFYLSETLDETIKIKYVLSPTFSKKSFRTQPIKNHEYEIIAFICSGKNRVEVYGGVTGVFTSSGFGVSLWESAEKCIG